MPNVITDRKCPVDDDDSFENCNGHGTCNFDTGKCKCQEELYMGESCGGMYRFLRPLTLDSNQMGNIDHFWLIRKIFSAKIIFHEF